MSDEDHATIDKMLEYGGSFVKALALAANMADDENLQKIKDTWPEYWQKYTEMK